MARDDVYAGATASDNETSHGVAQAALRRNAGLDTSEESTPLLRDGATAQGATPTEWEGYADLQGLFWWQRPHVR